MAHDELNMLLDALLKMAETLLSSQGAFLPVAAKMSSDGEVQLVAADTGEEFPGAQPLIKILTDELRSSARDSNIRAAAICIDVLTVPPGQTEKTDAIWCGLEHRSGECGDVYRPYRRAVPGEIEYGDIFATKRIPQFFASRQ